MIAIDDSFGYLARRENNKLLYEEYIFERGLYYEDDCF